MMKPNNIKILKISLCSLLLILVSCSSEEDKRWRNDFITMQFNGVENAYGTDERIYNYRAVDDIAVYNGRDHEYCRFSVYTLKPLSKPTDLKEHLNQFLDRDFKEKIQSDPNTVSILPTSQFNFRVKWLYNKEVTEKTFEPIDSIIKNGSWYSQTMYDRYNECLNFIQDDTQAFAKKYSLDVHEEIRYKNFDKNEVIKVLRNPNTLVKIGAGQTSVGTVYFYDHNYQYFITLQFQPSH